jgi:hypothetical protein
MSPTAVLGIVFVALALASTFLMFQFWGYAYDKEARKSACPQWKMNVHRAVGYAYAAVYVVMMIQMVPRLWQYQIEFPARTTAHIMLGLTIGVILLIKISILRWFRHFEEWMPALGVGMLLCTVLLVGLSLPIALRAGGQVGHDAFDEANRTRVRGLLDGAGFAAGTDLDALASADGLREGRRVLLDECTFCHDLKTAIARPRTPADWRHTVERMAEKPTLGPRLDPGELDRVTAYLVAITPDLQQSAKAKRAEDEDRAESARAAEELERDLDAGPPTAPDAGAVAAAPPTPAAPATPAVPKPAPAKPAVDLAKAKAAYQRVCSQCHPTSDTDDAPPKSRRAVDVLIARMVENGLEASRAELALVRAHLLATYVGR